MRKIKKWLTATPAKGEKNNTKKITVPGMVMTPRQLVERYRVGSPVPQFTPIFHGETYVPDTSKMDIHELNEFGLKLQEDKKQLQEEIDDFQQLFKQKQKEQAELAAQEAARRAAPAPPAAS